MEVDYLAVSVAAVAEGVRDFGRSVAFDDFRTAEGDDLDDGVRSRVDLPVTDVGGADDFEGDVVGRCSEYA